MFKGYWRFIFHSPEEKAQEELNRTFISSEDKVKKCGAIPPIPIRIHGMVLN